MTDKVVILITAGSLPECETIAGHLIEFRLAACVNITQPIRSLYRWEGKVADEEEFLMIVKTRRDLFDQVKSEVLKNHSYTTPEIICLPIIDGAPEYLQWIGDSVKPLTSSRDSSAH